MIKEAVRLFTRLNKPVELEESTAERFNEVIEDPEGEEPKLDSADLLASISPLRYEELKYIGKEDRHFLIKELGILHHKQIYLANLNENQLYDVMVRLFDYVSKSNFEILDTKYLTDIVDQFLIDAGAYVRGEPIDLATYDRQMDCWINTGKPIDIGPNLGFDTVPVTYDHVWVDRVDGQNVFATREGLEEVILELVDAINRVGFQPKYSSDLRVKLAERMSIISTYDRHYKYHLKALEYRKLPKIESDTPEHLRDTLGDIYPSRVKSQHTSLQVMIEESEDNLKHIDKLYETVLENKKIEEACIASAIASIGG